MLYHNIINSSKDRLVKQIPKNKEGKTTKTPMHEKVRTIAEEINIKLEAAVTMKKSEWKRTIKDKVQNKIQEVPRKGNGKQNRTKNGKRRQVGKKGIYNNM